MKTLIYTVILICFCAIGYSQNADIHIEQDEKIDKLLGIYKSAMSSSEYYRIQVGFGNSDKARTIKSNVEIDFPELPSRIDFDSPTYRVRVGRFKTKLEAERKFNAKKKKLDEQLEIKVSELKAKEQDQIDRLELKVRTAAVLLPPIPALLLGLVVLVVRMLNERRQVVDSRRHV